MSNDVFLECMHKYLGLPSPKFTQEVAKYGDLVARSMLRGGNFKRAHDLLEFLFKGMVKNVCITVSFQSTHLFYRKVFRPAIDRYNTSTPRTCYILTFLPTTSPSTTAELVQ